MANKQPLQINFAHGLDTKTDPKQVSPGKFLALQNTVFNTGGLLQKRNGYKNIAAFPGSTYLTTLNGNLTAVGSTISAYSSANSSSVNKGTIQPMEVSTLPMIRNSINQNQCDSVVAPNGLCCVVYTQNNSNTDNYFYAILDSVTGQNIVSPTPIPASNTAVGSPRVFLLGNYFILVYTNRVSSTNNLAYVAISTQSPQIITTEADIANAYIPATTLSWDGVIANNNLYIAYNTISGGQSVKVTYLTPQQASLGSSPQAPVTFSGSIATIMSLCADISNPQSPIIYASFYDSAGGTTHSLAVDVNLVTKMSPTSITTSGSILNVTSAAQNGVCTIYYEVSNTYSYDSGLATNYVASRKVTLPATVTTGTVSPAAGTAASGTVIVRSVGLASKAFIVNNIQYFLSAYSSTYQPTYFLINGTTSLAASPQVVGKLAYENGGGYLTLGLPSVSVYGAEAQVAYLYKDFIAAENTVSATPVAGQVLGAYSQTGINLGSFTIGTQNIDTAEVAGNLHISGGFLWSYDGYYPVEHNFFLFPDNIEVTGSTTGGSMTAQEYFYCWCFEWEDNQGNVYRSAPSIPVSVTTTGSTSTVLNNIPYLRLTYKIPNAAKLVGYRWSQANPIFYRFTSLTHVILNQTTTDSLSYTDGVPDSAIIGNDILYTTGGVVEDVNGPATNIMTLFDTRLWLVDAEDPNLLWFSKQVIEATPVEMSDLFTFYVAPTTAAQGSTGPITALAPMDDKLIIFKENAIYYINGTGPDNTGSNNNYSQPIYITSTVGCANQSSIVFMPSGIMFQSSKGIWLLGRDLSTQYIGAPVEQFNSSLVQSAVNVPETNEVRFTLSTGQTLMYDYYYQQWGAFVGVPAISSCVYQGLHAFLNSYGKVLQEDPGSYLDDSNPVLISFTTSWLNLAGISGYQRIYEFQLLGDYISPHLLSVYVAFDFGAPIQHSMIHPTNYTGSYGSDSAFGQTSQFGGPGNLEQWRVQTQIQKCQVFQITIQEVFDSTFGVLAGQGLNLSGINCVIGVKKGYRPLKGANSVG